MSLTAANVDELLRGYVPRVLAAAGHFRDEIPDYFDVASGRWHVNGFWTEGFWPGLMWNLYSYYGDARLADEARRTTRLVAKMKADTDDHDRGFLFLPSCVREHEITGDAAMLPPALAAARQLANRFVPSGNFISAHGPLDGPGAGFAILDTVMNLRLLFWAARHGGETTMADIAVRAARTMAREHMRPNGSSCQVLWFDLATGRVVRREAVMAVSVDSCWARAQAWGVHGFAQVYQETRDEEFGTAARRMAEYFLARVPADGVVFHDLDDPAAPAVPRDTSAQAIAAGGLLTLAATGTAAAERERWFGAAERLLTPLVERYIVRSSAGALPPRGLLGQGCKSLRKNQGINSELIFGDYHFVDALVRWRRGFG